VPAKCINVNLDFEYQIHYTWILTL